MTILLFFFYYCICNLLHLSSQYKFDLCRNPSLYLSHPYINICYGNPPQCLNTVLDINTKLSGICSYSVDHSNNAYKIENSNTVEKTNQLNTLFFPDGSVTGKEIKEKLFYDSEAKFTLLLIEWFTIERAQFDNFLGLQLDNDENEYSLIQFLAKHQLINKKMFSITPNTFYLGEMPISKKNENLLKTCKCNKKFTAWNCEGSQLETQDQKMSLKFGLGDEETIIKFVTRKEDIDAPLDFALVLFDHYKTLSSIRNNCEVVSLRDNKGKRLKCTRDIESYIPSLFGFDIILKSGYKIKINSDELFYENEERGYNFILNALDINYWEIGDHILKKETMIFDMDNYEVSFYEGGSVNISVNDTLLLGKKICIFIFFLCLSGISQIIFSVYKNKPFY